MRNSYRYLLIKYNGNVKTRVEHDGFDYEYYIPEKDMYIDVYNHWSHGNEPYEGKSYQMDIVKTWQQKDTPNYNEAVYNWTVKDVYKRKKAKEKGLNYKEFYDEETFKKWLEENNDK